MKKRIIFVILVFSYLIVPTIIKALPIYELMPIAKHEIAFESNSVFEKIGEAYYRKYKQIGNVTIMGHTFKPKLKEVSNGRAIYLTSNSDGIVYNYMVSVVNPNKFRFVVSEGALLCEDFKGAYESGEEILSQYVDMGIYNHVSDDNRDGNSGGPGYEIRIDGYITNEYVSIGGGNGRLISIDTINSGYFTRSDINKKIDEDRIIRIISTAFPYDYGKEAPNIMIDTNCYITKTANSELVFAICSYDVEKGNIYEYIYLFPRTAWLVSKYVLGISATLMFTWVLVSEIKAYKRKKSVPIPTEEEQTE